MTTRFLAHLVCRLGELLVGVWTLLAALYLGSSIL